MSDKGRFDFSKFGLELFDPDGQSLKPQVGTIEANMLRSYANNFGRWGNIIELGSYCGGSSCCIGLGLKDIKSKNKLICMDVQPKNRMDALEKNIKTNGLSEYIECHNMKVEEACKKDWDKISMIFWDAVPKNVDSHFVLWFPLLMFSGVYLVHMYSLRFIEVFNFVNELKNKKKPVFITQFEETAVFMKGDKHER